MKINFPTRQAARAFVSNAKNKGNKKVVDNGVNAVRHWSVEIK